MQQTVDDKYSAENILARSRARRQSIKDKAVIFKKSSWLYLTVYFAVCASLFTVFGTEFNMFPIVLAVLFYSSFYEHKKNSTQIELLNQHVEILSQKVELLSQQIEQQKSD